MVNHAHGRQRHLQPAASATSGGEPGGLSLSCGGKVGDDRGVLGLGVQISHAARECEGSVRSVDCWAEVRRQRAHVGRQLVHRGRGE
jgi:hypothetical protein